jgi:ribosomal protein L44E
MIDFADYARANRGGKGSAPRGIKGLPSKPIKLNLTCSVCGERVYKVITIKRKDYCKRCKQLAESQ